jgi:hypothetical protein
MWHVDLEVRSLARPIHSGRGGGPIPDPVQVLCGLVARLRGTQIRVAAWDGAPFLGCANRIVDGARATLTLPPPARREDARRVAKQLAARPPFAARVRVRVRKSE